LLVVTLCVSSSAQFQSGDGTAIRQSLFPPLDKLTDDFSAINGDLSSCTRTGLSQATIVLVVVLFDQLAEDGLFPAARPSDIFAKIGIRAAEITEQRQRQFLDARAGRG